MDNVSEGMKQGYDGEAKVVQTKKFRTSGLMSLCQERHIQPRSLTREKLIEMGVGYDKLHHILPIVAEKILEFYGLQAWEMRNEERVKSSGVTKDHYNFITQNLDIEGCFGKFMRSNIGDRIDYDGQGTQYERMSESFGRPETASQKVIIVDQAQVDKTLNGWYENDIKRMEFELKQINEIKTPLSPALEKTKKGLEESIDLLTAKLKTLNEDGTSRDGSSE